MKTFFCNRTVDKSEMKRLIKWVLLNYGTQKATRFVDHLKTLGFHSATTAGISLGIDDLRIPPIKSVFLKNAEKDILDNDLRYTRGQITAVERLEKALDIWNTTNDTLKNEVISHFRQTDIFNPVYMMAFSGARGNISQVRQLVGMRGLMADQQGQVLDFPIRRNFREGLTVTEYMISCYGARKGLVDTALRTANSGYLTRRLVDVAQSVIIQQFDCGTTEGLEIVPSAENDYVNVIGRVLLQPVLEEQTGKYIARRNTEISPALARQLVAYPKLVVRSPLTCRLNAVCQLCYGWDLSKHKLVQLGEAVGVLAAQSIGEPGTQLTMRTFHTGGVFAGEATEKVYAPYAGVIAYSGTPRGRKVISRYGEPAFLSVVPVAIKIQRSDQMKSVILKFPAFTLLFVSPGQYVNFYQSLAEVSRVDAENTASKVKSDMTVGEKELVSPDTGQMYFDNVKLYVSGSVGENITTFPHSNVSSVPQKTKNTVFGYGFIWLLSGYQLKHNVSYQGDYFNRSFQPLHLTSSYSQIVQSACMDPLSSAKYGLAVQKLLKAYLLLRDRKVSPFRSVKTDWVQQQWLFNQVDQFSGCGTGVQHQATPTFCLATYTSTRTKTVSTQVRMHYPDPNFTIRVCNLWMEQGKNLQKYHVAVHASEPVVGSRRFTTRPKQTSPFAMGQRSRGKSIFRMTGIKGQVRRALRSVSVPVKQPIYVPDPFFSARTCVPLVFDTPYKYWTQVYQTFPLVEGHNAYGMVASYWEFVRIRSVFPLFCPGQRLDVPRRFPDFQSVSTRSPDPSTSVHYPATTRWDAVVPRSMSMPGDKKMDFMYAVEGEIRLPQLAITQLNQHVFSCHGKKCVVNIGAYIRVGDEIIEGMQTPYSGQVIHINSAYVIIRRVYPYAMSHGSSLFVNHGDLIQKNTPFGTLVSLESTAGDIVQGLPKVDELLEAREPVEKILSSVHAQLAMLFLLYSKAYGMQEGCRRSLQKIRRILVNEVQAVYSSQGVFISDKHIEIIVRQMTTYVMVVDPGETNLLPGDIVDLRRVEHLVDKSGMAPVQYRPILLGITRASLAAESFIAAASFQETKRVLTRAAVEGHIDWLTGLKENVILGRLIPAGTGLYV